MHTAPQSCGQSPASEEGPCRLGPSWASARSLQAAGNGVDLLAHGPREGLALGGQRHQTAADEPTAAEQEPSAQPQRGAVPVSLSVPARPW